MAWRLGVLVLAASAAIAQTNVVFIDSIAGAARFDNLPPRQTPLIQPQAVWAASNGDLYISDGNFMVRRVRGDSTAIVAGAGTIIDDSLPVPALNARFDYPAGIVGLADGTLFIADVRHHRVRRLNPNGTVQTIAGTGEAGFSGDGGRATFAQLRVPTALALDPGGTALYIADTDNRRIRRLDLRTNVITTYAGTGAHGNAGDGAPAARASLGVIRALATDRAGNLYLVDNSHYVVRRIDSTGTITRIAGTGKDYLDDRNLRPNDGGPALEANISVSFGAAANDRFLFIAETSGARIRRITLATGIIETVAGRGPGGTPGVENVPATEAALSGPTGISIDAEGNLFIPEANADLVRRVDAATGAIATVAGTWEAVEGVQGAEAPLYRPTSVAADANGNLYIADSGRYRVRRVDRQTGAITTIAGDGRGVSWPGVDPEVSLGGRLALSVDPQGRVLIADAEAGRVRRVDPNGGRMETLADINYAGDTYIGGEPASAVATGDGTIYFSDRWNDVIWVLAPGSSGPRLFAGTGTTGFKGDGGPAADAQFNYPEGLALDNNNGLLICDYGNHVVRRIDLGTGNIARFAGDGIDDYNYDGYPAIEASLRGPKALGVDSEGYVFIADERAHAIRMVDPEGKIITLSGNGDSGFTGDGQIATLAKFDEPSGIALFTDAEVFICDKTNYRIRKLFVREVETDLKIGPERMTFRARQGGAWPSGQLLTIQSSLVGFNLNWDLSAPGFTGDWLYASYLEGETPDVILISVQHDGLAPGRYTANMLFRAAGSKDVAIPVELIVDPPNVASSVDLAPRVLNFSVPRDGAQTQTVAITSAGSNRLQWGIQLFTNSPWLRFGAQSGATPSAVTVTANAAGLQPGTYTAVGYFVSGQGRTLFVANLEVTAPRATLQLDRDIVVFETTEGSTASRPQPLSVFNAGTADLNWDMTIPAGATWLRASAVRGTVRPGTQPVATEIAVDPSGLRAGVYNAAIPFRAPGAANSPSILSVRLRVLPAATTRATLSRNALVFRAAPGDDAIPAQTIDIGSTGGALSYTVSLRAQSGGRWLSVSPEKGTVVASSQREAVRFTASGRGLADGVYTSTADIAFSDGTTQQVPVQFILRAGATRTNAQPKDERGQACSASRQVVVTPSLPNNFQVAVGWPVILQTEVYDDCGVPMTETQVTVTFSNGDAPKTLTNLRNGQYTGTWTPSAASGSVTIGMQARHPRLPLLEAQLSGQLAAEAAPPPVLFAGGVQNAASRRAAALMAPGSQMVLNGAFLPASAADATVLINGQTAQVLSSSPGEVRILAPQSFDGQSRAAVIVSARGITTSPEIVNVVPADPGLFPLAEGTTATAGGTLAVAATGLGAVDANGRVTLPVTARFGEREAQVTEATLPANANGVYQLRIAVPQGLSGSQELVVLQNGVASNPIPVAVR